MREAAEKEVSSNFDLNPVGKIHSGFHSYTEQHVLITPLISREAKHHLLQQLEGF